MAFFVQQPERRNLLVEGVLKGMDRGFDEAQQHRLMQRQQEQTQSALQPLLGQGEEIEALMADPNRFNAYVAGLPIPEQTKKTILDGYNKRVGLGQKSLENAFNEAQKKQEKAAPLLSGLKNLDEMEKIFKKGNLGLTSGVTKFFSKATQKDRAKYERLGKTLIQLSTNIPIRNKAEFEALAESIYDPSALQGEIEGNLEAMKSIISDSLRAQGYDIPEEKKEENQESINAPKSGEVIDGWRFKGGDPSDEKSWEKI